MTVVAVVQARMGSTRLPGKILADINGEPMLAHVMRRTIAIPSVDVAVVATSALPGDDSVAEISGDNNWPCVRGSEADVLDRYHRAARLHGADHVLRVTADCPLLCVQEAATVIDRHLSSGNDYTHNLTVWGSEMPLGTGTEIFTFEALDRSWREGHEPHHREHVDEYVGEHPELFRIELVTAPTQLRRSDYRLTVDTSDDLVLIRRIYAEVPARHGLIEVADVVAFLDDHAEIASINQHVKQKTI
jgi:spore coat polysaccharide biosynthesis protein SpsF